MEVPSTLKIAVNNLYNMCNERLDVFNEERITSYVDEVLVFKTRIQEVMGEEDYIMNLVNSEDAEDNTLHRNICKEIGVKCEYALPGNWKRKLLTHTYHFLQEVHLFYKEFDMSTYTNLYTIDRNSRLDVLTPTKSLGQESGRVARIFKRVATDQRHLTNNQILGYLKRNRETITNLELLTSFKEYEKEKKRLKFTKSIKNLSTAVPKLVYRNILNTPLQIILAITMTSMVLKYNKIKTERGTDSATSFIQKVKNILEVIIFLRKVDLMCFKRSYYEIEDTGGEDEDNDTGSSDGEQNHRDFIQILSALKTSCDLVN